MCVCVCMYVCVCGMYMCTICVVCMYVLCVHMRYVYGRFLCVVCVCGLSMWGACMVHVYVWSGVCGMFVFVCGGRREDSSLGKASSSRALDLSIYLMGSDATEHA